MDHPRFWSLVDAARSLPGPTGEALARTLATLPPADIVGFDRWMWAYYMAVRREDLWAAVFAIRGGCGDDSFDYFRGWLIGRGQAAVLAAIADPEALVELVGDADPRDEAMLGAARAAYAQAGHGELPDGDAVAIPGRDAWPADRVPAGAKWDAAFYKATFPKLYATHVKTRPVAKSPGSISEEAFWALLADAIAGTTDAAAAEARLDTALRALAREELIGFERWLYAYDQALATRADVRAACKRMLGADDVETRQGFRGWLILQGRAAVRAMTNFGEVAHATHPPVAQRTMLWVTLGARERFGIDGGFAPEQIPDLDTWVADRRPQPRPTKPQAIAPTPPVRVRHPKFGDGTVVSVDTSATEPKLVIDFASGRKTIARRFVEPID